MWAYNLDNIIPTCRDFEDKLIKLVWNQRSAAVSFASSLAPSTAGSAVNLNEKATQIVNEKEVEAKAKEKAAGSKRDKKRSCGLSYFISNKDDVEKTAEGPSPRPIRLFAPVYNGLGVAMSICASYTSLSLQWLNPAV